MMNTVINVITISLAGLRAGNKRLVANSVNIFMALGTNLSVCMMPASLFN